MDLSRYTELFLTESRDHLTVLNRLLLELERAPDCLEPVSEIFRAVHTIKGMAAALGYTPVASLAHELETVFDGVRREALVPAPALIDLCLAAADVLERAVEETAAGDRGATDATSGTRGEIEAIVGRLRDEATRAAGSESDARAEHARAAAVAGVGARADAAADVPDVASGLASAPARPRHVRIALRRLDALLDLAGELVIARGRLLEAVRELGIPAVDEAVADTARLIGELQNTVLESRMVPVGQLFDRYPRLVRDTARALGKEVRFVVEGSGIELDRSMLDEVGEAVVHLLRNAIDHGIEAPAARVSAGKPAAGHLTLSVARERAAVIVRVTDDGRGIDRARVLRRAREQGLVDKGQDSLGDAELVRLIAMPGFSTAERVTDLSGRGVGVDAVIARVRGLGGSVDIRSVEGEGTTVTVRLPLTLAIVRALLARVADEVYAVPLTHVHETLALEPAAHRRVQGRDVVLLRDDVLPLVGFRELLQLPPRAANAAGAGGGSAAQVIVLAAGDRRAGLVVDELAGQQDIVVKQFDAACGGAPLFSGATILADGAPALIVDVPSLL